MKITLNEIARITYSCIRSQLLMQEDQVDEMAGLPLYLIIGGYFK